MVPIELVDCHDLFYSLKYAVDFCVTALGIPHKIHQYVVQNAQPGLPGVLDDFLYHQDY